MRLRVLLGALALTAAVSAIIPADAEARHRHSRHCRHGHHGYSAYKYKYYGKPVIVTPRVYYDYDDYYAGRYDPYYDDRYYDDRYDDRYYDDRYYGRGYAPRYSRYGYHVHRDRHYCPYPRFRYRPHVAVGARGGHFGFYIRF